MCQPGCPACSATRLTEILCWHDVPVNNALFLRTAAEARAHLRATLRLTGCNACGFLFNAAFDETLPRYDATYIETQSGSPRHDRFADSLARTWIDRYGLSGKTALEIGCGHDAGFLRRFCSISGGNGIGIDPAVDASHERPGVELIAERFGDRAFDRHAAALICRHTLEHIADVAEFLSTVRRWGERNPQAIHLFEVPDARRILAERAFWDVYYEHCSYFTLESLTAAFDVAGFTVERSDVAYGGQYIILESRLRSGTRSFTSRQWNGAASVVALAEQFAIDVSTRIEAARAALQSLARDGTVVIWQASSKAVSLLTLVGAAVEVAGLVDLNPAKRGLFIVGSGHPIFAPQDLPALKPRHIVVMNSIYLTDVRAQARDLGVDAQVHGIDNLVDPGGTEHASTRSGHTLTPNGL